MVPRLQRLSKTHQKMYPFKQKSSDFKLLTTGNHKHLHPRNTQKRYFTFLRQLFDRQPFFDLPKKHLFDLPKADELRACFKHCSLTIKPKHLSVHCIFYGEQLVYCSFWKTVHHSFLRKINHGLVIITVFITLV